MPIIALAGNPNVGKSTLFNALTGFRQHTGNWPGKTVEKKEGIVRLNNGEVVIVDLPGTYSLTAYSIEETISRDFIINTHPNLVIVVVDANNLERNLYLVTQILELGVPTLIALNMLDVAQKRGIQINVATLSQQLGGIPVVETIGNDAIGLDDIRHYLQGLVHRPIATSTTRVQYPASIERAIKQLVEAMQADSTLNDDFPLRWLAIKLLEDDPQIRVELTRRDYLTILHLADEIRAVIVEEQDEDAETLMMDTRYMFINQVVDKSLQRTRTPQQTWTDRIDRMVTNRVLGIPIFLLLMWFVFQFTSNVSAPLVDWIDLLIGGLVTNLSSRALDLLGLQQTWIASLLLDGILPGVGGVLVFIPVLMSLYIAIGILEDSGYMARAAFVMDRGMRWLGLHGKSFLPMLVGFGCTVPAVYATRTLENETERKLTGFLLTFMSCGARLPIYVVFGAAFFGAHSGNLIFGMYLLGIVVALLTGFLIRKIVLHNEPVQPFVMELPPYRRPRVRDVLLQTWERTAGFIRKATSVILGMSILIWFLLAIPVKSGQFNDVAAKDSLFGQISNVVAPVFAPAGFGEWEATGSLITGMVAKEVVIGSMAQVYLGADGSENNGELLALSEEFKQTAFAFGDALLLTGQEFLNIFPRVMNLLPVVNVPELSIQGTSADTEATSKLESALRQHFSPAAAVAFTAFILLYVPCVTTLTAMRQEFGIRWTLQQIAYTTFVAWSVAVLIFQVGIRIGEFG